MSESNNPLARKALRSSNVSTVVSISLVLFMLGVLGVLVMHARKISDYVRENLELTVVLLADSKEADVLALKDALQKSEAVKEVTLVTQEQAATAMKQELGEDFVSFLGFNPLLASLDVRLRAEFTDNEYVNALKERISQYPVVKEVYFQQSLIDSVNKNIRMFSLVILGFSLLLALVAGALINNTIRIALYSKRLVIKSMRLVGATKGFIQKPFVLNGILQGLLGGVIANILLAALVWYSGREIPDLANVTDVMMVVKLMIAVLLGGMIISGVSTFVSVNRYLKRNSAELF
ncbi:MAG: cell division protein FtsX [Bacteroidota bacterium]